MVGELPGKALGTGYLQGRCEHSRSGDLGPVLSQLKSLYKHCEDKAEISEGPLGFQAFSQQTGT